MRTRLAPILTILLILVLPACGTWDPSSQGATSEDAATGFDSQVAEGGRITLTVGDKSYNFDIDECYASEGDNIEVRASTAGGEKLEISYDTDAPRDRTIQVINEDGTIILDGNATEGVEDPNLTIKENGFAGTATFRRTDGSMVGGEMSGTC